MNKKYIELLRILGHLRRGWNKLRHPSAKLDGGGRRDFYYRVWKDAAEKLNAQYTRMPNGFVEIGLNGTVTRMYENIVKIDDPLVVKLVRVKPFVHKQLQPAGIAVPQYCEFMLENIEDANAFLQRLGKPCVVKPASGEAAGHGVTTNVRTERELLWAAINASLYSLDLVIEEQIEGISYRMLFLDGKMLDATRRRPPVVLGDGKHSILDLIEKENARRSQLSEGATLTRIQIDADCRTTLERKGLSLRTIPAEGEEVEVKTAVNDNAAEDNISCVSEIGKPLVEELARATTVLGIRLAGIDLITPDPSKSLKEAGGAIIEVNSSPGLHHHYNVRNLDKENPVAIPVLKSLLGI